MSRLISWEIDSLLFAEAAALVARFPDVGRWEIIRRLLNGSGPAGRLRRRFPERENTIAHVLLTAIGESPNVDYYPFLIVFQP